MIKISRPRFELGRVVATPTALKVLEDAQQSPIEFLDRHVHGDWGDLSLEDRECNEAALRDGSRILSAYITRCGEKIWIITEAADVRGNRPATTILLPEEY